MGGVRPIGPSQMTKEQSQHWFASQSTPVWVGDLGTQTLEQLFRFLGSHLQEASIEHTDRLCAEALPNMKAMDGFVGSIEWPLHRAYFCVTHAPKSVYLSADSLPECPCVTLADFEQGIESFVETWKSCGHSMVQLDCGLESLVLGYKLKQFGFSSIPAGKN
jgi:hypothetical protein